MSDFISDNLSSGIWTRENAVFTDDLWNPGAALLGDGATRAVYSDNGPATLSGSAFTIEFWFLRNGVPSSPEVIIAQRDADSGAGAVFNIELTAAGFLSAGFFSGSTSNQAASRGNVNVCNNVLRHVVVAVDGDDVDIFTEGVETTYDLQDFTSGDGFAMNGVVYSGTLDLTMGAMSPQTTVSGRRFLDGIVTRPRIRFGVAKSAAQALTTYNVELAAQGEGFGLDPEGVLPFVVPMVVPRAVDRMF